MRLIGILLAGTFLSAPVLAKPTNDSSVALAAKNRDVAALRMLIRKHVDVNVPLADGATALHWAVQWDSAEAVDLLLKAGARVNVSDEYGTTPLWLACVNGNSEVVQALLKGGADPKGRLPNGETMLMAAARTGSARVIDLLIAGGAAVNENDPESGQTALMWAAAEGHAEAVRHLLMQGADPAVRSTAGYTAFVLAARSPSLDIAKIFLDAGVNVNQAAANGTTALVVATIRRNLEFARFLLEHGADPNAGPGFTPLHWAVGTWNRGLEAGRQDEDSEWARFDGLPSAEKLPFIKLLVEHGADVKARAKTTPRFETVGKMAAGGPLEGATPFFIAAKSGDIAVMRFLLANGADPSVTTVRNTTPLMAAAGVGGGTGTNPVPEGEALEAVKICVEIGNDVNAANVSGETALHGAAFRGRQGQTSVIQFLADHGAKLDVKNSDGWTPLTIVEGLYFNANDTKSDSGAELLRKLGAAPTPPDLVRILGTTGAVNQ